MAPLAIVLPSVFEEKELPGLAAAWTMSRLRLAAKLQIQHIAHHR
jgi:hypothetical protein